MDATKHELTNDEIVEGLRNADDAKRRAALDALFPEGGVFMIKAGELATRTTATRTCDPSRMFIALLYLAQQFGKHLGMQLSWVPEPDEQGGVIVPEGNPFGG